jgi:hypothetical protein
MRTSLYRTYEPPRHAVKVVRTHKPALPITRWLRRVETPVEAQSSCANRRRADLLLVQQRLGLRVVLLLLVLVLVMLALVSCTAGANLLKNTAGGNNGVAGFWRGLWHGFICLFTLIASLFSDSVSIYEVHNNGGWYNFGFVLGAAMFFGCGGAGSRATTTEQAK